MKIKILLACFTIALLAGSAAIGQTDEYYRPDSLNKERPERKEIPPIEKREVTPMKQEVDFNKQPFIDRVRLGGSFGLSLGTVTNINLSPMAG
jgi:hypothetical protein